MDALGLDRDREARRHLWFGLKRMAPAERVAFVRHCCGLAKGIGVRVSAKHSGTTGEAYADLTGLSAAYSVDLRAVCVALEAWLRKGGGRWHLKASSRGTTRQRGIPSGPRALPTSA